MDQPPKRPHRATGKPRGGKRPGAGRPPGPNLLEYGETSALRAMKLRLPDDAPESHVQLAGEALERLVRVMRGEIHPDFAGHVRGAAKDIREEVCKPLVQKVAHAGADGEGPVVVELVTYTEDAEP